MTGGEWLASTDLGALLDHLGGEEHRESSYVDASGQEVKMVLLGCPPLKCSRRKFQLFACACCRQASHVLNDERVVACIDYLERYADGKALREEGVSLIRDVVLLEESLERPRKWAAGAVVTSGLMDSGVFADSPARSAKSIAGCVRAALGQGQEAQIALLREIVGNPFRSVRLDRTCLQRDSGAVPKLSQAIYDERAFDRLPILADALEDADCDDADILAHCRSGGEHVRGCWVVDLLLGKE
jgi:hypothetical protein